MRFVSTNGTGRQVSSKTALAGHPCADGGLWMPESVRPLPQAFFNNAPEMNLRELAYVAATALFDDSFSAPFIKSAVDRAFAQEMPLVQSTEKDNFYFLECFHGPTMTVKDPGARLCANLLCSQDSGGASAPQRILVTSSGNSAVALGAAFSSCDRTFRPEIVMLYPHGALSARALSLMPGLNDRRTIPVEAGGSISDCNTMVRGLMSSLRPEELEGLYSVNATNFGRIAANAAIFFHAYASLSRRIGIPEASKAVYSIPCGNLALLAGALLAGRLGMPMGGIIAAEVPGGALGAFLDNNTFVSGAGSDRARTAYARAMNVSRPSCLPLLTPLAGGSREKLSEKVKVVDVTDTEIARTIRANKGSDGYEHLDPHTAAAYCAASKTNPDAPVLVLATAHPSVCLNAMTAITGGVVELPHQMMRLLNEGRHNGSTAPLRISPTVPALRKLLTQLNSQSIP